MRIKRHPLIVVVLLITLFATAGLSQASPLGQPQTAPIRLKAITFTPTPGVEPALAAPLREGPEVAGRNGYYLVQFRGPVQQAWKTQAAKLLRLSFRSFRYRLAKHGLSVPDKDEPSES